MPFKKTATKAHAVVNELQLKSSVFSSFLNIVKDKDRSVDYSRPLGPHKKYYYPIPPAGAWYCQPPADAW